MLLMDFETRSRVNLKTEGGHRYFTHPSTTILCAGFTRLDADDEWEHIWRPSHGSLPVELVEEILDADYIAAHNAPFDRGVWEYVAVNDFGFPEIPFEKWYCSAAQCRVNNLPASLEDAARALNSKQKKDRRGAELIRLLSIPRIDGEFNNDPALLDEMDEYCLQDNRTMKSIMNSSRLMTEEEHNDWLVNERINDRGIKIDTALCEAAQEYAAEEFEGIGAELSTITNGAVEKHTQSARAVKWALSEVGEDHPIIEYMTKFKRGEEKRSLDKQIRGDIISAVEAGELGVPEQVLAVVELLHEASASSVTKFKNMAQRVDPETSRVHGALIYAGASQTMRFSSMGVQTHNLPSRGLFEKKEDVDRTYNAMMLGADIDQPVMQTLKKMLRSAIIPERGKKLIIGDWTGIEARVLPWLSDSSGGYAKLDKIAGGVDVYMEAAEAIGTDNRTAGKVMELACGYQGGIGAFKTFAKGYGVHMPDHEIKTAIKKWRALNSWAVEFWSSLERAAMNAVKKPGQTFSAGRIDYMYASELMEGSLLCFLPGDNVLTYPKARLERKDDDRVQLTALKASIKMKSDDKEWPRESLYGGQLAGHATQGTAAALLRWLLSEVSAFCIAHVHDEVILEVVEERAESLKESLGHLMCLPPEWAEGLPLSTEPEIVDRYTK